MHKILISFYFFLFSIKLLNRFFQARIFSITDVCRLPEDPGPCSRSLTRYFFHPETGKCQLFIYGGCLGNNNRFITKVECEEACASLLDFYATERSRTTAKGANVGKIVEQDPINVIPPVPTEVFEQMRRITSMHSETYRKPLFNQTHVRHCPNHAIMCQQRIHVCLFEGLCCLDWIWTWLRTRFSSKWYFQNTNCQL